MRRGDGAGRAGRGWPPPRSWSLSRSGRGRHRPCPAGSWRERAGPAAPVAWWVLCAHCQVCGSLCTSSGAEAAAVGGITAFAVAPGWHVRGREGGTGRGNTNIPHGFLPPCSPQRGTPRTSVIQFPAYQKGLSKCFSPAGVAGTCQMLRRLIKVPGRFLVVREVGL